LYMDNQTIKKISDFYIRNVDKYYRMCSGLSSDLDDYRDQTIFLTIRISAKWPKSNRITAIQMARSWKAFNPELADARRYQVTIKMFVESQNPAITLKGSFKHLK